MTETVFWFSILFVAYAYFGYPLSIFLWPARHPRRAAFWPRISFVIAVHNERERIDEKIRHLLGLPYPADLREVVVVSDGSTDGTAEVVAHWGRHPDIRSLHYDGHRGKAWALNKALELSSGEIVVFLDARQQLEPDSVPKLLENFSDPEIGCVSGDLRFKTEKCPGIASTIYWRYERLIRRRESLAGSSTGATGAFYAIRRSLFRPLPEGLILDDVFTPMQIALAGWRVIHDSRAIVWDVEAVGERQEFRRKVRTLAGNYQLFRYLPALLRPGRIAFQFFSRKIARLLVPIALFSCVTSNLFLPAPFYGVCLAGQCVFYLAAAVGLLFPALKSPVLKIPQAFVALNGAAIVALFHVLRRKTATWKT